MKYLIIYEKSNKGWGAYAPDLPGLGAAGKTLDEVKELIREAVEFHVEGMRVARRSHPCAQRDDGIHHGLSGTAECCAPPKTGADHRVGPILLPLSSA